MAQFDDDHGRAAIMAGATAGAAPRLFRWPTLQGVGGFARM
jgi:hypothetical protein